MDVQTDLSSEHCAHNMTIFLVYRRVVGRWFTSKGQSSDVRIGARPFCSVRLAFPGIKLSRWLRYQVLRIILSMKQESEGCQMDEEDDNSPNYSRLFIRDGNFFIRATAK